MRLNLFRIAYPVTSLGPGLRVVIWVAGCRKRCPGCISPEMRDPAAGDLIEVSALADHLTNLPFALDGITISGGEPFAQAEALAELLQLVRKCQSDWNVLVYSGNRLTTLRRNPKMRRLLAEADILIDGRYRQEVAAPHPIAGSGNQAIHFLSTRGEEMMSLLENMPQVSPVLGLGREENHLLIGVPNAAQRGVLGKELQGKRMLQDFSVTLLEGQGMHLGNRHRERVDFLGDEGN